MPHVILKIAVHTTLGENNNLIDKLGSGGVSKYNNEGFNLKNIHKR